MRRIIALHGQARMDDEIKINIADDFNRADTASPNMGNTSVGNRPWSTYLPTGNCTARILNNQATLVVQSSSTQYIFVYLPNLILPSKYYLSATVSMPYYYSGGRLRNPMLLIRYQDHLNFVCLRGVNGASEDSLSLIKVISGAPTVVSKYVTTFGGASGTIDLRFEVDGNLMTGFLAGVARVSETITELRTIKKCGLGVLGLNISSYPCLVDNFILKNL
jgi:hypothetical protein